MLRYVFRLAVATTTILSGAAAASAQGTTGTPNFYALGITAGTLGLGGEVSFLAHDNFVFRVNGSYIETGFSVNLTNSTTTCADPLTPCNQSTQEKAKYDLTGRFAGGMVDWHAFKSGWRLSAGVRYHDLQFNNVQTAGASIGSKTYSFEQVGKVRTVISNSSPAAPYLGFGYDAAHFSRGSTSFNLGLDVGAIYSGQPDVKITTDRQFAGLATEIATETQKVKDSFQKFYAFYPVIMLSGKVSF